jgi:hypothetical protein
MNITNNGLLTIENNQKLDIPTELQELDWNRTKTFVQNEDQQAGEEDQELIEKANEFLSTVIDFTFVNNNPDLGDYDEDEESTEAAYEFALFDWTSEYT